MKILAIDGSSTMRSAALCRWQQAGNQFELIAQASGVSQRGGRLTSLVREVLQESGEKPESVDRIVVGVGPGSTAGIRSTLAFALGWSVALGTPAVGISSVWALASRAREKQLFGQVTCLIRGTAGRIYRSSFQISSQRIAQTRPLERIHPDQLCSIANDCHCIVGPEAPEILSAFPSNKKESSFLAASVFPERLLPTAVALAWLAHENYKHLTQPLEPLHLESPHFVKAPPPRKIPKR